MRKTQGYYNIIRRELADIEASLTRKPMYMTSVEKHLKSIGEHFKTVDVKKARKMLFSRAEQIASTTTNSADVEIGHEIARYIGVVAAIGILPYNAQNVVNRQHWMPIAICKHFANVNRDKFSIPALIQYRNGDSYRMMSCDKQFILPGSQRHNRELEEMFAYVDAQYATAFNSHLIAGAMFVFTRMRNPYRKTTPKNIPEAVKEASNILGDIGNIYIVVEHVNKAIIPLDPVHPIYAFARKHGDQWYQWETMALSRKKLVFIANQHIPLVLRTRMKETFTDTCVVSARRNQRILYGDFVNTIKLKRK